MIKIIIMMIEMNVVLDENGISIDLSGNEINDRNKLNWLNNEIKQINLSISVYFYLVFVNI
jgi:hypothetical protein